MNDPRSDKNYIIAKILLTIISCSIFFFSMFLLRSCKEKQAAETARIFAEKAFKETNQLNSSLNTDTSTPEIILKNAELFVFGNDNFKHCSVLAEESKIFHRANKTECTNVQCKVITNQNTVATLQAPKAFINNQTKNLFLPGAVHGTYQQWNLEEHNVTYHAPSHTIAASNINISSATGIQIQAKTCKIDLNKELIYLKNGVSSYFERAK